MAGSSMNTFWRPWVLPSGVSASNERNGATGRRPVPPTSNCATMSGTNSLGSQLVSVPLRFSISTCASRAYPVSVAGSMASVQRVPSAMIHPPLFDKHELAAGRRGRGDLGRQLGQDDPTVIEQRHHDVGGVG